MRAWRERGLIGLSCIFILLIGGDPLATLPFWLLLLAGFVAVRCARHAARPALLLTLALAVVLLWWALHDRGPGLLGASAVLGLSWAMFRILHLLVDARDDALGEPLTWRRYLCYLTFFPAYLAGPVMRYQAFAAQRDAPAPRLDRQGWGAVLQRAVSGLFKWLVLAGSAAALHEACVSSASMNSPQLTLAALSFTLWLYFAFSGYTDLAISVARVLGVTLPENFAQPLRTRSFLDLWSRWHISLSEWFKFYVFNPSLKWMLEHSSKPSLAPWLGAAAFFLAFFLMGLWHGRSLAMLVYGLALGAGVSLNKGWQIALAQRLGRKGYAALAARPEYQVLARALALTWFVLALVLLWQHAAAMPGWATLAAAASMLFALCLVVSLLVQAIAPAEPGQFRAWTPLLVVLQLAALALWLSQVGWQLPELLYIWI